MLTAFCAALLAVVVSAEPPATPAVAPPPPAVEPLTNVMLIAALPPEVESAAVYRIDHLNALGAKKNVLPINPSMAFGFLDDPKDSTPFESAVRGAACDQGIDAVLMAGSKFEPPHGLGVGPWEDVWAVHVRGTLKPLAERLADGKSFPEVAMEGRGPAAVFHGQRRPIGNDDAPRDNSAPNVDLFAAFPDEHTVVYGAKRATIGAVRKSIAARTRDLPAHWKAVVGDLDITGPFLVVRRYDPNNERDYLSPVNPKQPEENSAKIDSIALVVPAVDNPTFRIRVTASEPAKALSVLSMDTLPRNLGFVWDTEARDPGLVGSICLLAPKGSDYEGARLMLFILFGMNFAT